MKAITLIAALTWSVPLFAQSASGGFHLGTGNDAINIEFNVANGQGVLMFRAPVPAEESDETTDANRETIAPSTTILQTTVQLDCVAFSDNRASMSGMIRDANVGRFNGQRLLLAVEDGGEGSKAQPDQFSWGFYTPQQSLGWTPSDADLEFDDGWKFSWFESDAERPDDRGVLNQRTIDVDCKTFALSTLDLISLPQGSGNIQVRP